MSFDLGFEVFRLTSIILAVIIWVGVMIISGDYDKARED